MRQERRRLGLPPGRNTSFFFFLEGTSRDDHMPSAPAQHTHTSTPLTELAGCTSAHGGVTSPLGWELPVGPCDGVMVGPCDGVMVGSCDGVMVGPCDGVMVGPCDGMMVRPCASIN